MPDELPVLIAGAGIGGLTLACALRREGVPCALYEKAPVLRPVGAGITMQGNAMLAFRAIGLYDLIRSIGAIPRAIAIRHRDGHLLAPVDLDEVERKVGAPTLALHRGALHEALHGAIGDVPLALGAEATGFRDDGDAIVLELAGGGTVRGRAVVGADGLHSAIRTQRLGETPLRYVGYTSWRGVTGPGVTLPADMEAGEALGRGERFGWVPVGGGRVYWFGVAIAPPGGRDDHPHQVVRARFGDWGVPAATLVDATAEADVLRTDVYDRAPSSTWGAGRVTLLGDAAHPMTPNLGQGGAQAVEDAVVLARSLARGGPIPEALRRYERTRMQRANRMVVEARRLGRVFQASGAVTSRLRNLMIRAAPDSFATRQAVRMMLDGLTLDVEG